MKRLKHKGQFGHSPYVFTDSVFFNSFTPCSFHEHPNQGQMEDSFQNSEGKITKLKKGAKSQLDCWIGAKSQLDC
jgi:hypothetical protein